MGLTAEDLKQFRAWVEEAIVRSDEVAENFPDERLHKSVRQQLDYLFSITRNGHSPTHAEAKRFALGLTSRRLEGVDPKLATLFSRLSNYLESDAFTDAGR